MLKGYKLPDDLLFGTATASLQIEGGDTNNNWYRFCEQGRTKDGSHCIVADDHWNRYAEDIALMKELNQQLYRMSIEWSRIEPSEGNFDEAAIAHYRLELELLLQNGIRPIVTLHHFSHPLWFEDMGGWVNPRSVECFIKYAGKAVQELGDLVAEWVTINEPNVYLEGAYSSGNFPPHKPSLRSYFTGLRNMSLAHIKAYKAIHSIRKERGFPGETLVGFAKHVRVFDAGEGSLLSGFSRNMVDYCFHTVTFEAMINGRFCFPIGHGNYPLGRGKFCDYMGLNYYSRDIIKFTANPGRAFSDITVKPGVELNDLGWEIYPEGLYRVCKKYYDAYGLPVFITENGICDHSDSKRARYIYDHLEMVKKLRDDGVDVRRYYHWTLMDNFEWEQGLAARFGLIEVDYDTQKRTIRPSGRFYSEIALNREITPEMIEKYLPADK